MPDIVDGASVEDFRLAVRALEDKHAKQGRWLIETLTKIIIKRVGKTNSTIAGVKRKAETEIFVCKKCDQPYSSEEADEKECIYHPGYLDVDHDDDFWADHDEDCHGTIDTPEMREENPEGFIWDCCERKGDERGCRRGKHSTTKAAFTRGEKSDDSTGEEFGAGEEDEDEDNEVEDEEWIASCWNHQDRIFRM